MGYVLTCHFVPNPQKMLKNKWKSLLVISSIFIALEILLYMKYQFKNKVHKEESHECVKKVVKQLKNLPSTKISDSNYNLDWQLMSDVDKHLHKTGQLRNHTVYLTIGIPSIKRIINSTYLMKTLEFLTLRTTVEQKKFITCVILLSDLDDNYNKIVENQILLLFPEYLNSGFFHILRVKKSFYPPLKGLKRNFNDAENRISWRAKQVSDYVLLFRYCSNLSEYHIQIEDDVECSIDYFNHIKYFINSLHFKNQLMTLKVKTQNSSMLGNDQQQNSNFSALSAANSHKSLLSRDWSILDFSILGFIGKLFHSTDLKMLATFLATFYDEQPVDWLIVYWIKNMGQSQPVAYKPSLFQHFGLRSSFNFRQDNKLQDKHFFSQPMGEFQANPLAVIYNNMTSANKDQVVENVYVPQNTHTFELTNGNSGMSINFIKPENVDNITVSSGKINNPVIVNNNKNNKNNREVDKDCFKDLSVYIGRTLVNNSRVDIKNEIACQDLKLIGQFSGCLINVEINENNCECIFLGVHDLPSPVLINGIIINSKL